MSECGVHAPERRGHDRHPPNTRSLPEWLEYHSERTTLNGLQRGLFHSDTRMPLHLK